MSNIFPSNRAQQKRAGRREVKLFTDENELYEYAAAALLRRMRTVIELKRLLRQRVEKGGPGDALIDAVIARLSAREYLSDTRYAAEYSTLRKDGRRLGARRVAQDLLQKGVPSDVVAREAP